VEFRKNYVNGKGKKRSKTPKREQKEIIIGLPACSLNTFSVKNHNAL
jgi:hypothetical protein